MCVVTLTDTQQHMRAHARARKSGPGNKGRALPGGHAPSRVYTLPGFQVCTHIQVSVALPNTHLPDIEPSIPIKVFNSNPVQQL